MRVYDNTNLATLNTPKYGNPNSPGCIKLHQSTFGRRPFKHTQQVDTKALGVCVRVLVCDRATRSYFI